MLAAMGYEPLQARGDWGASVPRAVPPAAPARSAPSARTAPSSPIATDRAAAAAPPRAGTDPAAFAAALRRAAGGGDVSALVDDLERLRRDPAAKRALWPRLRALRRLQ
jgi:hypothetical protein